MTTLRRTLEVGRNLATGIAIGAAFFLVVEGLFSSWAALESIFPQNRLAESLHTRHDELLGWVNIPNTTLKGFYGEGRDLRINSQGFRADREAYAPRADGGGRLVCSGDSFAMGYGVGNERAWCHLLQSASGLETLNMGQGGYGVDQAYLWFKRDGALFEHNIHLFTFTTGDFERMLWEEFSGYQKPMVGIEDGSLVVVNAPLPLPGLVDTLRRTPYKLLAFQTVRALFHFGRSLSEQEERLAIRSSQQARIVSLIFEDLKAINARKKSRLIAVHLPTDVEIRAGQGAKERARLRHELERQRIPYWDLTRDFSRIPARELSSHFIPPDDPMVRDFPGAPGHYNERGNAFVADVLRARLGALEPLPSL